MKEHKVELTEEERRELEKKEKEFKNATQAEKRVLVAKDVLERLEKDYIRPNHSWGCFPTMIQFDKIYRINREYEEDPNQRDEKVKKFFDSEVRDVVGPNILCSACALGSLFVCTIIRADDLKVRDLTKSLDDLGHQDIATYFRKLDLFSNWQMNLIETAYERGEGYYKIEEIVPTTPIERVRAYRFGRTYHSDTDRLKAIMENIIENGGEFVPPTSPFKEDEEEAII